MAYRNAQIETDNRSIAGYKKFKKQARNRKMRRQLKRDHLYVPQVNRYHGYY